MLGPFGLKPKKTMAVRALPIAKALAGRGHSVTLLLPPWSCPEDSGRVYEEDGVRVENIVLPTRLPLLFHYLTTRRLVKRALALEPDVVHCFKPKAYAGLSAWWLWQLRRFGLTRARLVVDTDDWEGAGGWNDRERYSWAQRRMFAWQEQWGLRHCDALTVASRALESIVWSMGVASSKVFYVPNGVEVGSWKLEVGDDTFNLQSPRPLRGQSNLEPPTSNFRAPTILLYTRFFEFNIERVLSVFGCVLQSVPEARLLVVGQGLFGEEQTLLAQAQASGWGDRVEYAGWIDPAQLPAAFARADTAIYPFDDTLLNRTKCPVKLTELLAAGVPVVADAVGQMGEYIRHNATGLLIPSGDVAAMATALVSLLNDQKRARELGEAAARDIRARFGWNRLAKEVEQAYGAG
ncbi:MAG TPA: glycosyltransferase family 4 protein [Anaerolineae bacterium]|nr:glycosyltransferase family 4 protein [Anaerolineae bacterium]